MIRRLLIANRGEIALRIIAACRELGIETVAVYSAIDAAAIHATAADRAVAIGPAPAVDSYLSISKIIDAAKSSGADAIHPGYGFLSENAAFAAACERTGIAFVGPPSSVLAKVGSKISARAAMLEAGVPIVPGDTPADQGDVGVRQAILHVGLPALIKASQGGGGKGMRLVRTESEIDAAVQAARREAAAAFGDGTLYVERMIERPHHVEVQILGDAGGSVVHVFERECSVQRRHQKVIEESPSPSITGALRTRICDAAVRAARAVAYRNAGTVEFLVDPTAPAFYFLEINARLQVEHPVTEQTAGVDLVRAQLLVAAGEPLPWRQEQLAQRGHAIEARVYAEDPAHDFLPQAGRIAFYREPRLPGVRIDAGIAEGSDVPVYYDPLLAKAIAWAETRELAIARLFTALRGYQIGGIRTNIPFLLRILDHPAFRQGVVDTTFLDRESAVIAEAIGREPEGAPAIARADFARASAWWDPWSGFQRAGRAGQAGSAGTGDPSRLSSLSRRSSPLRPKRRGGADAVQSLTAPMPATVIKVLVKPGDAVKKGDTVIVLEAMKMELPLRAAGDATVTEVRCREGELVQPEAILVELT